MKFTKKELFIYLKGKQDGKEEIKYQLKFLKDKIIQAKRFLYLKCYFNERTLTFNECNQLYNILDEKK